MPKHLERREFLIKGTQAGLACCAVLMGAGKVAFGKGIRSMGEDEPIDPKKLEYCGYKCPDDCKMRQASVKNDPALKKEAYELWRIKEKYNVDFDPDAIYCFGCKNPDKPEGLILTHCTVRSCAISKGLQSCIECDELTGCEKELWKQFPDFKQMVIEMQKKYRQQG